MERRKKTSIEDYAIIGDGRTAALVHRDGSIDWMCVPRFDSPACFASLLGSAENGCWQIAPAGSVRRQWRRYRPDSLVLETEFETDEGAVRITDFMPWESASSSVIRLVTGISGVVPMQMRLSIRFDYGRLIPWLRREKDGEVSAILGPHALRLRSSERCANDRSMVLTKFTVKEGQSCSFELTYGRSYYDMPAASSAQGALQRTDAFWREWSSRCNYVGPWREAVLRSLITLKALTYAPTGGIAAALTTSVPEQIGGVRNWDYRYCWLRDATFTLLSLMDAGYIEEADAWRKWLIRAVAGDGSQVQALYDILGQHRIEERELPWLSGFADSRPVRIGNAAYLQLQLDVFGEVLDALHQARRSELTSTERSWQLQRTLIDYLESVRDRPDCGIWEVRGGPAHFTHSKVMTWVAFDRAVDAVEEFGLDGPVDRWRRMRAELHREICEQAYDADMGAFTRSYGSRELDAACLLMPIVGFLPPDDPRIVRTVDAIRQRLTADGLVCRYDTRTAGDGLPSGEGVFLACSFWLADNLILQSRRQESADLFERLLGLRNDVGLLAEQYDVTRNEQVGNFPQALSHVALISTAYGLENRQGPSQERRQRGRSRTA